MTCISIVLKQTLIRLSLKLFRGLLVIQKGLRLFFGFLLGRPLLWVGSRVFKILLLPAYSWYLLIKRRIKTHPRFAGVRSLSHFINHFALYGVLITLGTFVIGNNLFARTVHPDEVGQGAIWTAFVLDNSQELIVETASSKPKSDAAPVALALGGPGEATPADTDDIDLAESALAGDNGTLNAVFALGVPAQTVSDEVKEYTVKGGDSISTIASEFGISRRSVLWANGLNENDYIKPGQKLKIPPQSGVLYTVKPGDTVSSIAKKFKGNEQTILEANQLALAEALTVNDEIIIPGGEPPEVARPAPVQSPSVPFYQRVIARDDPPPSAPATGARFAWPVGNRRINQYYRGRFHTGIDIECNYGNPLFAAAAGTVTFASADRSGYGLHVIINHGNGFTTLYGHASKIFVRSGQHVNQGQSIAMCGSTGRSTGTHLHFEIRTSRGFVNPLAYF